MLPLAAVTLLWHVACSGCLAVLVAARRLPTCRFHLAYCREQPDEEIEDMCPQDIALKWHAEAGSGIYATPLITDLFSDGKKDIVVPAFQHHLEVRNGQVVCCAAVVEVAGARRCPPSSTTWRRVGCRVGTLFGCGWRWRQGCERWLAFPASPIGAAQWQEGLLCCIAASMYMHSTPLTCCLLALITATGV